MIYSDLNSSNDINSIISTVKREFKNLSQLTYLNSYETTMGQNKVLTIYRNLQPEMKVEGSEDLLDVFKGILEEEKQKFYSKH